MKTTVLIEALSKWGALKGFSLKDMCVRKPYKNKVDVKINKHLYHLTIDIIKKTVIDENKK